MQCWNYYRGTMEGWHGDEHLIEQEEKEQKELREDDCDEDEFEDD